MNKSLTAHCIYVTCNCNLSCAYCYQTDKCNLEIKKTDVKNVIQRINTISNGPTLLELFGGEPLLNWPVVLDLLYDSQDARVIQTIVTNGILLTPRRINILRDLYVHVRISYDGYHGHDCFRRTLNGQKTEFIVSNVINTALERGLNFGINMAVHRMNHEYIIEDVGLLFESGVRDIWLYPVKRNDYKIPDRLDFSDMLSKLTTLATAFGSRIGTGHLGNIKKKYVHTSSWFKEVLVSGSSWKDEKWQSSY